MIHSFHYFLFITILNSYLHDCNFCFCSLILILIFIVLFLFLFYFHFHDFQDLEEPEDWESDRIKMELKKPFCLRVYVYQCRGLPAIDGNGLIDPYVKVSNVTYTSERF